MPDREKVITALAICTGKCKCFGCWYGQNNPDFRCEDRLKADALALLRKQEPNKWISVQDKLPEKQGVYLVAFKPPLPKVTIAWWATREYGWYDLEYNFHTDGISHWMPLPPMPEQEVSGDAN